MQDSLFILSDQDHEKHSETMELGNTRRWKLKRSQRRTPWPILITRGTSWQN